MSTATFAKMMGVLSFYGLIWAYLFNILTVEHTWPALVVFSLVLLTSFAPEPLPYPGPESENVK